MTGGPRRTLDNHHHPEYWSREGQYRFEDHMRVELQKLEQAVDRLTTRVTMMLGGLTLVAVLLPVISPFIRAWLNIDVPPVPAFPASPTPGN